MKSHLDDATLKKIAEATGGMYQPLGAQAEGLETIYEQGLAPFTREDLSSRQAKVPLEKFLLAAARRAGVFRRRACSSAIAARCAPCRRRRLR